MNSSPRSLPPIASVQDQGPTMGGQLRKAVAVVFDQVRAVDGYITERRDHHGAGPAATSAAMGDLNAQNGFVVEDWGQPVGDLHVLVDLTMYAAGDHLRAAASLFDVEGLVPVWSDTVLGRASIEAASIARWLIEPGLNLEARLQRTMVERLFSFHQLQGLDGDAKELGRRRMAQCRRACEQLGWACIANDRGITVDGQRRPRSRERMSALLGSDDLSALAWKSFSAVTHSTMYGLLTGFIAGDPGTGVTPARGGLGAGSGGVNRRSAIVLHGYLSAADRALRYFGWTDDRWPDVRCDAKEMLRAISTA